jgi:hypothetical protein
MGKAIYSPRFSGGLPVSTAGVTFTSEWYQEFDPDTAAPEEKPVSTTPAEPAPGPEPAPKPASNGSAT